MIKLKKSIDKLTQNELLFKLHWEARYPNIDLVNEYKFSKNYNFRFDFAHIESRIGIDCQNSVWMKRRSGHNFGESLLDDYRKTLISFQEGWRLIHLSPEMINLAGIKVTSRNYMDYLESIKNLIQGSPCS